MNNEHIVITEIPIATQTRIYCRVCSQYIEMRPKIEKLVAEFLEKHKKCNQNDEEYYIEQRKNVGLTTPKPTII